MRIFLCLVILFMSCSPFRGLRQNSFEGDGEGEKLDILLARGGSPNRSVDVGGNIIQTYKYGDGATLFFVEMKDTTQTYLDLDREVHIPKPNLNGGIFYKGQDENGDFFREVMNGKFRYGYKGVSSSREVKFDSVVNYVRVSSK